MTDHTNLPHTFDAEYSKPGRLVARLIVNDPESATDGDRCFLRMLVTPDGQLKTFDGLESLPQEGIVYANAIDIEFVGGAVDRMLFDLEYAGQEALSFEHLGAMRYYLAKQGDHHHAPSRASHLDRSSAASTIGWIDSVCDLLMNKVIHEDLTTQELVVVDLTARLADTRDQSPTGRRLFASCETERPQPIGPKRMTPQDAEDQFAKANC